MERPAATAQEPSVQAVAVADALAELPAQQRTVATLFYLLDQPIDVIAQSLDVAEGTVKTHLHRARTSLALALGEDQS